MSKHTLSLLLALVWGAAATGAAGADGVRRFEGLVTPERQIALAAPSEGLVTRVLVREGDPVATGAPIAELASEEERIRLRLAELQSRKLAEDLASIKRLYEEKAASRDDYTRAMLAAEQAAVERDLAAIRLQERTIVAPASGHVLRLLKDAGESVRQLETFAEIVALDQVHVNVYVPAVHLGRIPRGSAAVIHPDDGGGDPVDGEVELADPVLDPGGEVFRVKVLVRAPGDRLRSGTRVPVEFPGLP